MISATLKDIAASAGHTPLVQINKLGSGKVTTLARLEPFNTSGSIKDRILDDTKKSGQDNNDHSAPIPQTGTSPPKC